MIVVKDHKQHQQDQENNGSAGHVTHSFSLHVFIVSSSPVVLSPDRLRPFRILVIQPPQALVDQPNGIGCLSVLKAARLQLLQTGFMTELEPQQLDLLVDGPPCFNLSAHCSVSP